MTETQQRPERPPVRPRSGRRPLPPLIFLLVLALAALAVWWNVLREESARRESTQAACSSAAAAVPSLDAATLNVRVLNASDIAGQAQRVAKTLRARGFAVGEVGNDGTSRRGEVTGVGEVRHGPLGEDAARFLALQQPGIAVYQDTRASATVDMVIGPQWVPLAPPDAVAAELAAQPTEDPVGC